MAGDDANLGQRKRQGIIRPTERSGLEHFVAEYCQDRVADLVLAGT